MFIPYRKPAKLSEKRARLSCISCNCRKFCSRSAIASLNSANPSCSPSSALPDAEAARPRWDESRKEEREEARRGVVGRDRGDLLRGRSRGCCGSHLCSVGDVFTREVQRDRRPIAVSTRCASSAIAVLERGLSSGTIRSKQYPTTQGKYAKTDWLMMPWLLLPKLRLRLPVLGYRIQQITTGRDLERLT